ncbi:cytochrome b/b6 domain-containing protein [Aliiglaciecola sp. LCG003]|uniref:cytochrome b/b6 domain-containing protein n=1 Tax=Aliiglaciecola sp. LCG003 TaxID=3053655 RepID=UPI0025737124|nr:cytochrome b/b6 domain-containing protein [Aliiglaciecola sp. LCG003]WJG08031.1 cytochrome b/b6 domain-containing protein [Aliiglaciecola sp. LCG003]
MRKRLIWDLPIRLFHWLLVLAIVAQWATAELGGDLMDFHFYIGYFTLGLIIFRLIWGFVGTKHSRFSDFLAPPKAIFNYFIALMKGNNKDYIGHNPVGGLLVPLVIVLLLMQTISGLFATDDVLHSGPYISAVNTETQSWLNWLHHFTFELISYVILFHIVAILWYKFGLRRSLIAPMISGYKQVDDKVADSPRVTSSRIVLALIIAALIAAFIYWLVAIAAPVPEVEYYF